MTEQTDECIVNVKCKENCEHISCRMQTMKLQGGRRTNPAAAPIVQNNCPQCNFTTATQSDLKQHIDRVHIRHPNCPFCQVSLTNLNALKKHIIIMHKETTNTYNCAECEFTTEIKNELKIHIEIHHINIHRCPFCQNVFNTLEDLKTHIDSMHSDNTERPSVIIQNDSSPKSKNICVFYLQPRGCKKGLNCTHSHETDGLQSITKVPKLCYNGQNCSWKPRCRYVHPEDGESIPARAHRVSRMEGRRPQVKNCHWSASECPRGGPASCSFAHMPEPINQGFSTPDLSRLPPGFSLREYPGLPAPRRPSVFRQNPQYQ